jgi:hypothetical protein
VDANVITQKEDHFDRRVRENFHKVNEKKWAMKSFSAIFAYFQNRVYQVKKISQFRFGKILFWKPFIQ